MTTAPSPQPPASDVRTQMQHKLMTDTAAWRWWSAGYERGVEAGYAEGYRDALRVLDEAGAFLATLRPSTAPDAVAARRRRDELTAPRPAEDIDARRRACAQSWGLSKEGAA